MWGVSTGRFVRIHSIWKFAPTHHARWCGISILGWWKEGIVFLMVLMTWNYHIQIVKLQRSYVLVDPVSIWLIHHLMQLDSPTITFILTKASGGTKYPLSTSRFGLHYPWHLVLRQISGSSFLVLLTLLSPLQILVNIWKQIRQTQELLYQQESCCENACFSKWQSGYGTHWWLNYQPLKQQMLQEDRMLGNSNKTWACKFCGTFDHKWPIRVTAQHCTVQLNHWRSTSIH